MREETQRAITAYPFDHPENILHLSRSLDLLLPLSFYLALSPSTFPVISPSPLALWLPSRISTFSPSHFYSNSLGSSSARVGTPSPPVTGALLLSARSPLVLFFFPSFSINSEFYLVRFAPCHCVVFVSLYLRVLLALKPREYTSIVS